MEGEEKKRISLRFIVICASLVVLITAGVLIIPTLFHGNNPGGGIPGKINTPGSANSKGAQTESAPPPTPTLSFTVASTKDTSPAAFKITTSIFNGTTKVDSFSRQEPIAFGAGKDYTALPGIITFRSNNYREGASYGTADVEEQTIQDIYNLPTGSVTKSGGKGAWTGSGWTGQPLIIKWPDDIKKIMNINPDKKTEADLTEVIYPCLDGNIYFFDLKDGKQTRPTIKTGGGPTKGTASIYPFRHTYDVCRARRCIAGFKPRRQNEIQNIQPH